MKNKRKSGFLLFWFSLLPGAGEMYLGFMKQGLSLMCLFWGIIALSAWLELGPFLLALPVLCFYSFFHSHNLFKLPDDQFYRIPDTFLFSFEEESPFSGLFKRFHSGIAIILVLFGISILWNCFLDVLYWILPEFLYNFFSHLTNLVPRIAIGLLIIGMGLYVIRGKKQDLSKHTDWGYPEEDEPEPQDWGYQEPEASYESPFRSAASPVSSTANTGNTVPVTEASADTAASPAAPISRSTDSSTDSKTTDSSQIELIWPGQADSSQQ